VGPIQEEATEVKKDKTINLAARTMAEARWAGTTAAERKAHSQHAAQAPRTGKRCFCGASSMWRAANRYFDCCRKAASRTEELEPARPPCTSSLGGPAGGWVYCSLPVLSICVAWPQCKLHL
jgi:hypothetical protein